MKEGSDCSLEIKGRHPQPGSIDPFNAYHKKSVYVKEKLWINFGRYIIDLSDVEQLAEISQTKAIMEARLKIDGLDSLSERVNGNLSEFRMIDLSCAHNRLRLFLLNRLF